MTVLDSQHDLEQLFQKLFYLARKKRKRLSFFEATDFISAMSGMDVREVRRRLMDVDVEPRLNPWTGRNV